MMSTQGWCEQGRQQPTPAQIEQSKSPRALKRRIGAARKGRAVMTYKIESGLGRIMSPITLLFPDWAKKEYKSGKKLCEMAFDRKYRVTEIRAVGDRI